MMPVRVNVLIFLQDITNKTLFDRLKSLLFSVIDSNCYVCYCVGYNEETLLRTPWHKGAKLALLYGLEWDQFDKYKTSFDDYLKNYKGHLLLGPFAKADNLDFDYSITKWISSINETEMKPTRMDGICEWKIESGGSVSYLLNDYVDGNDGDSEILRKVFSRLDTFELNNTCSYTNTPINSSPIYLYGSLNYVVTFYNLLSRHLATSKSPTSLHTVDDDTEALRYCSLGQLAMVSPITEYIQKSHFSYGIFIEFLKTKKFGRILLHSDVITSTLDIFNKCPYLISCQPEQYGITVLARQQTAGIGRNNNTWISPIGSLLTSITYKIVSGTPLYKNPSIIQHILCLAFILAIKESSGLSKLPIYIKWPNDIYYKDETKIGGVLVNNYVQGNNMNVVLSLGANITNEAPTLSLNSIIKKDITTKMNTLSVEEVLAKTLNQLEYLIEQYNSDIEHCHTSFEKLYLKHLIKYGKEILVVDPKISNDNTESQRRRKGMIRGINEYGYLKVLLVDSNKVIIVHPDGNPLDITENATIFMNS